MKKIPRNPLLSLNKTQRDFQDDAEIGEEQNDERQQRKEPNALNIKAPPLKLPLSLFKRKASNQHLQNGNQPIKISPRLHIRVKLSPQGRTAEKNPIEPSKEKGITQEQAKKGKSPRELIHKLKVSPRQIKEIKLKRQSNDNSPRVLPSQQKKNEELWEAACKGDLIKITHLLDPYCSYMV